MEQLLTRWVWLIRRCVPRLQVRGMTCGGLPCRPLYAGASCLFLACFSPAPPLLSPRRERDASRAILSLQQGTRAGGCHASRSAF